MKKFLKQFGGLVTGLRDRIATDIFVSTHLRIVLLYFVMGAVILGIAGVLAYNHILNLIQDIVQLLSGLIKESIGTNEDVGVLITTTIVREIKRVISAIGIWVTLTLVLFAYLLASITLRPIKRSLERQKRFVANVSHELRTPLSIMRANAEVALLNESDVGKEELVTTIKNNIEEMDRMAKILQFLLNFSSFENKMKGHAISRVDLAEVAKKTVELMQVISAKRHLTLEIEPDETFVIRGNAIALQEMMLNMIKNAIQHTPKQGFIRVTLEKRGYRAAVFAVSDTGTGIPREDLAHIFEPFYRGGDVSAQKKHNAGLGLAIVKEIAAFQGGTVAIESEVGEGTKISVRFPLA